MQATAGETSFSEPTLNWSGHLSPGDEVTVTYSVTVTADGDQRILNVVTTQGTCVPAEGQDAACVTEHEPPAPAGTAPIGPSLPYTGSNLMRIALAGLAALLAGNVLLRAGRRRVYDLTTRHPFDVR